MPILPESRPASEQEIDAFLAAFEAGTLPKEEFTHAGHLLAGACYVHMLGEAEAIAHMRQSVRSFNEAVGGKNTDTGGYHETITIFWIMVLVALRLSQPELSRADFAVHVVQEYRNRRDLFRSFYHFDVLASVEARRNWIAPSLKTITAANL
jgi:hypothetical protein